MAVPPVPDSLRLEGQPDPRGWRSQLAKRFARYQHDAPALSADSLAALSGPRRELPLLVLFLLLLIGLPAAALAVGADGFGDKWAFGLTLILWPILINVYGTPLRQRLHAGQEPSTNELNPPPLVFFLFALACLIAFPVLLRALDNASFGGIEVLRGFLWAAALASALEVARDVVAGVVAIRGGAPIYARGPAPGDRPGIPADPAVAPKPRHPIIRSLLALLGLAAIALACLILVWPAPFSSTSSSDKTTTEETQAATPSSKTTTVTETKTDSPSNALVGGLVGAGVLLLLAAALFDRLQELKGPGGMGIVLAAPPAPTEEEKQKVVELVPEAFRRLKGDEPTPEETARVTANALSTLWRTRLLHSQLRPENIIIARDNRLDLSQVLLRQPRTIGPIDLRFRTQLSDDELREAVGEAVNFELGQPGYRLDLSGLSDERTDDPADEDNPS